MFKDDNHNDDLDSLENEIFSDSKKSSTNKTTLLILVILLGSLVTGYYIYKKSHSEAHEEVIIISAEEDENNNKAEPLDPGGMVVSNTDKDVYDTLDQSSKHHDKNQIETLLPPAEEPIDKQDLVANQAKPSSEEEKKPEDDMQTEHDKKPDAKIAQNIQAQDEYIKPVKQEKAKTEKKFAKKNDKSYRVQIASFKSRKDAQKQWNFLSKRYSKLLAPYEHYIVSKNIEDKGIYQRLQVGPFETEQTARKACSSFKDAGLNCFVIRP